MRFRFSHVALGGLLIAGVVTGLSRSDLFQQGSDSADGPGVSSAPATPVKAPSSYLLTVQIDARGVEVVLGTKKPDLEFSRPKIWDRQQFHWIMRDQAGKQIAEGGFDPGRLDLDPAHLGQPGQTEGDLLIPTVTHTNVKVPALADFASLEFHRRQDGGTVPFGAVRAANINFR